MPRYPNFLAAAFALAASIGGALADPVKIVAAESVYGDIAKQIGGEHVAVISILNNPDQDPHLFEASVEAAKALAEAKLTIANGANYDPWMEKLLKAHKAPERREIVVGALVGRKSGDNPHLWYQPLYMKAAAKAIADQLSLIDPTNKNDFEKGAASFSRSLTQLDAQLAKMRETFAGVPVTASEPVFGYAADLIGLQVRNQAFALAVMNNAEPSGSQVAAFESDLKGRRVKAMIYNSQANEPAVQRLARIAKENNIAVVGVTETEPPNTTYQAWMSGQLDMLEKALGGQSH